MKIIHWIADNILFLLTLFLLAFIPLFPKIPVLDVVNTWVYIRAEDFVIVLSLIVWVILLLRRKITLKTPLTIPIILFWLVGAAATIHGVLLIFPTIANVFPNVAFLSYLRRIEYVSLFFIAYAGMRDKQFLKYVIIVLVTTLLCVIGYGFGQKYVGFPAFLTMNEEFAKGIPIQLSALSRVPSTFGGHYDLAAYLVLVLPILTSLIFGFRNLFVKLFLLICVGLGVILLFMTVSRVSFFVLFVSLFIVLFFQKRKIFLFSLPLIAAFIFVFLSFTPALLERFGSTIKEIDVLVEAKTGEVVGHVQVVPSEQFKDNIIQRRIFGNKKELDAPLKDEEKVLTMATPSAIVPYFVLPEEVAYIAPPDLSTGENLPQGTGYINLSLSPVKKRAGEFFYTPKKRNQTTASTSGEIYMYQGQFLIKKASAYDLSFTTRYQGEWPRAIEAFKRNIFLGSGYGSVSLAVDNNYLRILGEIGLLGLISYFALFVISGIYIIKILPFVESKVTRSFILGFAAGVVGLALNAVLIDVFDASKIAFLLWLLVGVVLGTLHLYQKNTISVLKEFKNVMLSKYAVIFYICILGIIMYLAILPNYFVGDDFTWLRWAADCSDLKNTTQNCSSMVSRMVSYFTQSDGFFYRPGTKTYFSFMYSLFWLNQTVYHTVSLALYAFSAVLVYLLARKILHDSVLSSLAAFFFLILSGYSESVFWISSTGTLFNVVFILLSLLFFISWEEKKKIWYFIAAFLFVTISLSFHELGVIAPLLMLAYKVSTDDSFIFRKVLKFHYGVFFIPLVLYLCVRYISHSHWFSGDYSYNILKLPFNVVGNAIGYFLLSLGGPAVLPVYEILRNILKGQIPVAIVACLIAVGMSVFIYKKVLPKLGKDDQRIVVFCFLFFLVALLPFLGLGNITSRYSYLESVGVVIFLAFFIQKLYMYLLSNGKDIALASTGIIVVLFSLFHIIQTQGLHNDWNTAGRRAENFFISIDSLYADYWSKEPMEFHFVNVPIRTGDAWIFPVGLKDALWLVFQNPQIRVFQWSNLKDAMNAIDGTSNKKVFVFEENGELTEKNKVWNVQ